MEYKMTQYTNRSFIVKESIRLSTEQFALPNGKASNKYSNASQVAKTKDILLSCLHGFDAISYYEMFSPDHGDYIEWNAMLGRHKYVWYSPTLDVVKASLKAKREKASMRREVKDPQTKSNKKRGGL